MDLPIRKNSKVSKMICYLVPAPLKIQLSLPPSLLGANDSSTFEISFFFLQKKKKSKLSVNAYRKKLKAQLKK